MYYIIVNPASQSGHSLSIWQKLEPVFQEKKVPYQVMESTHDGHVAELVREITASDEVTNLIILGGDGTMNEALQGIRDFSKVNIGYIPTGSSNDLARDMKLSKDPVQILETILKGNVSRMADLGVLTFDTHKRYFVVSSGIGFDAAVCEEALSSGIKNLLNRLKLGKLTYLGIALKQIITAKPISCELCLDGNAPIYVNRFLFIASMIRRYEGGGFKFCPDADAEDGLLDLCFVGNLPKLLILIALPTAFFGKHYLFPHITHYRASRVEIKTSAPLWVHMEGEVHRKSNHICLYCVKRKLRFLN